MMGRSCEGEQPGVRGFSILASLYNPYSEPGNGEYPKVLWHMSCMGPHMSETAGCLILSVDLFSLLA